MKTSPNPFNFRRLPGSDDYVISNLLGEWALLNSPHSPYDVINTTKAQPNYDQLIAKGFINTSPSERANFERAAEHTLTKRYVSLTEKPSLVMVVPTLRCDHTCTYCQVSRAHLASEAHELELSPDRAARAIDHIAADRFKLEFQGGEPLLRANYVMDLVTCLRNQSDKHFEIVIASALGPDLERAFLDWCVSESVSFSVSFDGIADLHSKYRRSRLFDSYEQTINQYAKLLDAGLDVSFVATITQETLSHAPWEIIDHCQELGIKSLFSRPMQPYGFGVLTGNKLGCDEVELFSFLEQYLDAIILNCNAGGEFYDASFGIYLQQLYKGSGKGYVDLQSPSGYALSACILNYDGCFYGSDESRMLAETSSIDAFKLYAMDHINSLKNLDAHTAILANSFSECSPYCSDCAYLPFCGSDPIHHLHTQGDILGFKPNSSFCHYSTFMFDLLISRIRDGSLPISMARRWME